MSLLSQEIDLIRYLLVLKVTGTQVKLLRGWVPEFSFALGRIIANRLPKTKAKPWWKHLEAAETWLRSSSREFRDIPETFWPIHTVWFPYTQKMRLSRGETLFVELKLLSYAAEHHFFLETILPGLEEAGRVSINGRPLQSNLAGNFEIQSIYAARGRTWRPVVDNGRLDFRVNVDSRQWAEGLAIPERVRAKPLTRLTWITPLDLKSLGQGQVQPPDMRQIVEHLLLRFKQLTSKGYESDERFVSGFTSAEASKLQDSLELAKGLEARGYNQAFLGETPPSFWLGTEFFAPVPEALLPLLELASIVHLGRYTHFGYGTFNLG